MSTDARPLTDVAPATNGGVAPAVARQLDPNVDKLTLDAEGWAYLADRKWLNEEYNRGTWDTHAGQYIAVAHRHLIATGPDPLLLREQAAARSGVDPDRIVIAYVEPGIDV